MNLFEININGYELIYVFWNLFLAFIPVTLAYLAATILVKKKWSDLPCIEKVSFATLFGVWFFFLPNAAYLFTMVRHLVDYCDRPNFYDVCANNTWMVWFFFVYALVGLPTYIYALRKMAAVIKQLFDVERWFEVLVTPFVAIGLLFGLFNRLNSWEVITDPLYILQTTLRYFTEPNLLFNFLVTTVSLYLIYYGILFLIKKQK